MNCLKNEMIIKYDRVTHKADLSDDDSLYNDDMHKIAEEIEKCKDEWESLNNLIEDNLRQEKELSWLISELNNKDINTDIEFRGDIFERVIKSCILFKNGNIVFEFKFNLSREAKVPGVNHTNMKRADKVKRILEIFKNKTGEVTKGEISSEFTEISSDNISATLSYLCKSGYLKKLHAGPSTAYVIKGNIEL